MNDLATELRLEAEAAIAAGRAAMLRARVSHARAELMRHMIMTAGNARGRPRAGAIAWIVDHWLEAWHRDRATYPPVPQMEDLASACFDHVYAPGPDSDRAVRSAFAALERACVADGTTLADEMAWRSGCSHGWWGDVLPAPAGGDHSALAQRKEALWDRGCAPHCLG